MSRTIRHGKVILDLDQVKLHRTQNIIRVDPHSIHGTFANPTIAMSNISIQTTLDKQTMFQHPPQKHPASIISGTKPASTKQIIIVSGKRIPDQCIEISSNSWKCFCMITIDGWKGSGGKKTTTPPINHVHGQLHRRAPPRVACNMKMYGSGGGPSCNVRYISFQKL